MRKTILLVTHPNRREMLKTCLASVERYASDWELLVSENTEGPGVARRKMLDSGKSDVWCVIDDDMELTGQTNWNPAIEKCIERGVGLVSCNWIRSERTVKLTNDRFVKQSVVFTAGGMLFSESTANVLRNTPNIPWMYDNPAWSSIVYTSGLTNYRYLGSVAIHRICSTGGRKTFIKENRTIEPDKRLFNYRENHIPLSCDLTAFAKETHSENRKAHVS